MLLKPQLLPNRKYSLTISSVTSSIPKDTEMLIIEEFEKKKINNHIENRAGTLTERKAIIMEATSLSMWKLSATRAIEFVR